jgi:hypothetical protein
MGSQRDRLRKEYTTDPIPVPQTEDGRLYRGTREIFSHLRECERDHWEFAAVRRRRFVAHRDARESDAPGQLIEYFRRTGNLEAATGSVEEAEVVDAPEATRYELRLGGRLAAFALDGARWEGLGIVPLCPFIAAYIERHPEYEQLVASGYRDR